MGITINDLDILFSGAVAVAFVFVALRGFLAAVGSIQMDRELRNRYQERANFIENFYRIYQDQEKKLEEERHYEEEAAAARAAARAL